VLLEIQFTEAALNYPCQQVDGPFGLNSDGQFAVEYCLFVLRDVYINLGTVCVICPRELTAAVADECVPHPHK
jgi:hypothetical protein